MVYELQNWAILNYALPAQELYFHRIRKLIPNLKIKRDRLNLLF